MKKVTEVGAESPVQKTLYQIATEGAQKFLQIALQAEIEDFISSHSMRKLPDGKQRIVRNGYGDERQIVLPTGKINVQVPRTRDRSGSDEPLNFHSLIVPPYLRRATNLDEFIPFLYLKGVSTNDFSDVLSKLTGNAVSLTASTVVRLKESWAEDLALWQKRDLSQKQYVYWWADGINLKVRLEDEKACVLCIIGATAEGKKELIAIREGYRESETSWRGLMIDLKNRGLKDGPKLATADGALGFWKALREEFPGTREQRCWVHKLRNVLDKMPKSLQVEAKNHLHEIYLSPTRELALKGFDTFIALYESKYEKAIACLLKDKDTTLTYYEFPGEHWVHIRSTNIIESTFATVRLRTYKTKGAGNRKAALTMLFKLCESAALRWRRLRGHNQISLVVTGAEFVNGELKKAA